MFVICLNNFVRIFGQADNQLKVHTEAPCRVFRYSSYYQLNYMFCYIPSLQNIFYENNIHHCISKIFLPYVVTVCVS